MLHSQQSGKTMASSCGGLEKIGAKAPPRNADCILDSQGPVGRYPTSPVLKTPTGRFGDANQLGHLPHRKPVLFSIFPQKIAWFCHNDTYGIGVPRQKSIPNVSDSMTIRHYHFRMAKRNISPPFWARRLKDHMEQTGQTLANLAKKMRNHNSGEELVESTLRSWTNGHRKINLEDFIELCIQAKADPAVILFGRPLMTADVAEKVGDLMVELQRYSPSAPAPGLATNDAPRPAGSASVGKSKSARSSSKIHK